jgi:hypothetical protein
VRTIARRIRYAVWALNGCIGRELSLDIPQKVTVLITYYSPARMKHIEPQVRNILKCSFVDKLVVSNHNPDIHIDDLVKTRDKRMIFMNQETKRGCGYRWSIAAELGPEFLVMVDDDILLFPSQLAKLFKNLVSEPEVPHGFTGFLHLGNDVFEYRQNANMAVDFLCEVYAVTRNHLKRYGELKKLVAENDTVGEMIESSVDFMVISRAGSHKPKIHRVFRLFRCETFNKAGIAVHKEDRFGESMSEVFRALNNVNVQDGDRPVDAVTV